MPQDKYLTYRGDLKAVAPVGSTIVFVTAHAENQPTAVYRLDADKLTLAEDALPAGGVDVVTDGDVVYVAGTDRRVYRGAAAGGKLAALKAELDAAPTKLALLADGRLAALAGQKVIVLAAKDGSVRQAIELPEPGSAMAADPTGRWLVVGTNKGTVLVFDCEDRPEFLLSESAKLHEGAVTALLFEPDDLRFFSAGADGKLLSTHARGKLEPEDKGRGNNHADAVTALVWAPGDRFLSGGRDAAVKSWPRVGGVKPATVKDGLAKVAGLCVVQVHNRTVLAAACEDNTIRMFPLDAAGKVGELGHRTYGAAEWARHELASNEVKPREAALRQLAEWNDTAAVELIAKQVTADADHGLRLLATQLLAGSSHARAAQLLEKPLTHSDEAVRVAAFHGLRKLRGDADLGPLDLALAAEKADVGRLAVQALEKLAAKDDQALARLTRALDRGPAEVRQAALASLEAVHGAKSPEASLVALGSKHADLRRLALVRLQQRGMMGDTRVQTALRRATEDGDGEVRRAAFLLSLYTRERLAPALRARDPELDRQLSELEGAADKKESAAKEPAAKEPAKKASAKARDAAAANLDEADYDPLLQATASRALDTCLRGARGLAVLGDERALGLLLQLSREKEPGARVDVARALAALDDPRSTGRLRSLLFDADAAVRDAAFSALSTLNEADPLAAAEAGLGAGHEDVRRRGLQAVIAAARKKLPQSADDPAWPLFIRALNDDAAAVRGEAFKAALNLQMGGGGVNTLRFVRQSVHANVRREVLTEAMAQVQQPWAWELLLEFLNDPDPGLRAEAFEFATKKTKELTPLEAALGSAYPDVRRQAVGALVKRHSKAAQAVLARALADEDVQVRTEAIDALVGDDVRDALRGALQSPHDDVHARAAKALARHGDPAARPALVRLAAVPEPVDQPAERRNAWAAIVETALTGLRLLGDVSTLPNVLPLLDSQREPVRKAAGKALAWVALAQHPGALRQAMQHADPQVKFHAALGLALGGEASAAPLVFGKEGAQVLGGRDRLAAALALGPAGEDQFAPFLDGGDGPARTYAVLLLMLLELKTSGGVPSRCLTCLASREPRVRLRAARGLDSFRDPALFLQFVTGLFNDRAVRADAGGGTGEAKPWDVPAETVDAVAELIAFGPPAVRARTAWLIDRLFKDEQAAWDRAWAVHAARFADELAVLRKAASARKPAPPQYTPGQLEELAFGAYVGLVREQGAAADGKNAPAHDPQAMGRVRQTALTWLLELAKRDAKRFARPAQSVFVQALSDPQQPVRMQAFEQLRELQADPTTLGAEALAAGHTDLGVRALELLSGTSGKKGSASAGQGVLEKAMLTRTDDLATEAAKLLMQSRGDAGAAEIAGAALGAVHEPLRQQAVAWLAAAYEKSPGAQKALRGALTSRYEKVREAAALELATKKDPAAFDALVKLLAAADKEPRQRVVVDALTRLGDPRTPAALLDRVDNDPARTAAAGLLILAAGNFRRPEVADRLLAMTDRNAAWRPAAGTALLAISGYDQPVMEDEEGQPTGERDWEKKQFPRRANVLAALLDKSLALNAVERLTKLLPAARWSREADVDPVLARLAAHPDEKFRRQAVEAYGWRVRLRKASPEPLRAALTHRDPTTQFLAAEGLARAGRGDGVSVLLSAVDFLQDVNLRGRAVEALGVLGDARALDVLLKIATEDGHVLRDSAAEALGRLGRSSAADEVFKLLERLTKSPGSLAANAARGLRWLDTPAAWQLIREMAQDDGGRGYFERGTAVELLRYDDDPATRDLLLKLIAADAEHADAALDSARVLFGEDSLEPHYAWLRHPDSGDDPDASSLRLVGERGEPKRLFDVLPQVPAGAHKDAIATYLLKRQPLPVAEALGALAAGTDAGTVRVAARIVGRAGAGADVAMQAGPAVVAAVGRWQRAWDERRDAVVSTAYGHDGRLEELTATLRTLLWAAGRLAVAQDAIAAAATARPTDAEYRPVRAEAVAAIARGEVKGAALAALEAAAVGDDPQVRALAADALAARQPKRAAQLAERILADRVSFNRVAADLRRAKDGGGAAADDALRTALRTAATQGHYQGVALPHLIAGQDLQGLTAAAEDRKLSEVARLGAVEALGKLGTVEAEKTLVAIGANAKEDEALRKAAWRARRRSQRARTTAKDA